MKLMMIPDTTGQVFGSCPDTRKLVTLDRAVVPPVCVGHEAQWEVVGVSAVACVRRRGTVFVKPGEGNPCPRCAATPGWLVLDWDSEGHAITGRREGEEYQKASALLKELGALAKGAPVWNRRALYSCAVPAGPDVAEKVRLLAELVELQRGRDTWRMEGGIGYVPSSRIRPMDVQAGAPLFF